MNEPTITIELPLSQSQELLYAAGVGYDDGNLYKLNDSKNQTTEEKARWLLFVRALSKIGFACTRASIQQIISNS